jgi:hypothetical protein
MRFVIFVIDDGNSLANPNEMQHIDAFNQKLQQNGLLLTAAGISHGQAATVIDNRANKGEHREGSIQAGADHYSGFWLIEAADEPTAKSLAFEASLACNRKVELRPYLR